jgi:hypothetical protein
VILSEVKWTNQSQNYCSISIDDEIDIEATTATRDWLTHIHARFFFCLSFFIFIFLKLGWMPEPTMEKRVFIWREFMGIRK